MHVSGKIFAWLLIPLIIAAMFLTAKVIKVRNEVTAKFERSNKEYAELAPKVTDARFALEKAQAEWHRATETWGLYFEAPTTVENPAEGTLAVRLGQQNGMQQGQWLYGFEVRPDGTSIYRGDFVAETVRPQESLLRPNWWVRPGDFDGWQNGQWRWRVMLPSAYTNYFDEFQQTLLKQDELLGSRQLTLAIHQDLIQSATEQFELREAELVGGPNLPQDESLDPEFRVGLVAAIEELEESRNAELIKIDRLRRSVRSLTEKIQATQAENRELVRQLPQPATEVTQKP